MIENVGVCEWCASDCANVDFSPLRSAQLDWFWRQLAAAGDRRGDRQLTSGTATITAPASPAERAAALGLLGGRVPRSGQSVRVDLADLTERIRSHDPVVTPGMIAAHVVERSLGERVRQTAQRRNSLEQLRLRFTAVFQTLPETSPVEPDADQIWAVLQRTGWTARMLAASDPANLVRQAVDVIARLPAEGSRLDRRLLAESVTRNPHALDAGTLPGLVLAVMAAAGTIPTGLAPRAAWTALGVDYDDLTGGLLAFGIQPLGWVLPADAVVTLPPRELVNRSWPHPPPDGGCVFVTENPSIVGAAADLVAASPQSSKPIRLLCTVGTPSASEIDAIGRLAAQGWQIAVRADFDPAGLRHVASLLRGVPTARPWRMGARDYLDCLAGLSNADRVRLPEQAVLETPWDAELGRVMGEQKAVAYEEGLIEALLADLTADRNGPKRLRAS